MNHYIVDGNNLIGRMSDLRSLQQKDKQASREKLAVVLERYFIRKKAKVTLHFDGFANDPIKISRIKIAYSENRTADERIKNQIETSKNPKNLILISSDNNLQSFAKVCACSIIKSEDFVKQLYSSQDNNEEKERIASIDDPEEFKKLFGVD